MAKDFRFSRGLRPAVGTVAEPRRVFTTSSHMALTARRRRRMALAILVAGLAVFVGFAWARTPGPASASATDTTIARLSN